MATIVEAQTRPEIRVEDVEYQRQGGKALLARVYRPAGTGPFPAVVQVHGGAWTSKDRTDNDFISRAFAESGILVASLDFRMPPEAPYPASIADINLGIRWLKARARTMAAARIGSVFSGHRAAGIRRCSRRCGPTIRITPLCRSPKRRRSMLGSPLSCRAGASSTRSCATTSRRRPAMPSLWKIITRSGVTRRR